MDKKLIQNYNMQISGVAPSWATEEMQGSYGSHRDKLKSNKQKLPYARKPKNFIKT
jgi:hypothetical protein